MKDHPDADSDSRFPGYDVLAKRRTPSWNEQTREVIDPRSPFAIAAAVLSRRRNSRPSSPICDRIVPQPASSADSGRALVDHKLATGPIGRLSPRRNCRDKARLGAVGLAALDAEAEAAYGDALSQP